jgi:hypothetical protein
MHKAYYFFIKDSHNKGITVSLNRIVNMSIFVIPDQDIIATTHPAAANVMPFSQHQPFQPVNHRISQSFAGG